MAKFNAHVQKGYTPWQNRDTHALALNKKYTKKNAERCSLSLQTEKQRQGADTAELVEKKNETNTK